MDIIQGGSSPKIADAKIGDTILIYLHSGKVEKALLASISKIGIEVFEVELLDNPLTFYPFTSILKIKKPKETT